MVGRTRDMVQDGLGDRGMIRVDISHLNNLIAANDYNLSDDMKDWLNTHCPKLWATYQPYKCIYVHDNGDHRNSHCPLIIEGTYNNDKDLYIQFERDEDATLFRLTWL